jgi:hypothetical protein
VKGLLSGDGVQTPTGGNIVGTAGSSGPQPETRIAAPSRASIVNRLAVIRRYSRVHSDFGGHQQRTGGRTGAAVPPAGRASNSL